MADVYVSFRINLLYPELGGFIQPLGGEYGGYKNILENVKFTSGYGVEVQLLIEIYKKYGLNSMGQTNLYERIHRHQPINSLSKMSYAIMKTILKKWIDEDSLFSLKIFFISILLLSESSSIHFFNIVFIIA